MIKFGSLILACCLFLTGCNGCTDNVAQDATVDSQVDASTLTVDSVSTATDSSSTPCRDAGLDAAQTPGC